MDAILASGEVTSLTDKLGTNTETEINFSPNGLTETMPAGGSDVNYFDCKEAWYPVYFVEDLNKSKPAAFTLLGRNLVIWWDKVSDCWRVFDDVCPHRLAALSEGRINQDGLLECPYHGWAFSGSGRCEVIPQQTEGQNAESSRRSCVASLPATVRQGMLFVYAGMPENAAKVPVPLIDFLEDSSPDWVCINTFRDLPYDAFTLLENVLDSSHVPYTHHGTVGNRAYAGVVDLQVRESNRQGFKGVWESGPRRGTLGRQETTFIAPNLMWHDLTSKQFGRTLTVVYATPIRKGECRLFALFPFKFSSKLPGFFIKLTPRWYSHLGQNAILEDDQIFLHWQERYLQALGKSANYAKVCYLPTKADEFVSEFRGWVNRYSVDAFGGEILPPALPKEKLLDRYHSHTINCSSCSQALRTIQLVRMVGFIAAVLALASVPLMTLLQGTPAVFAAGFSSFLILAGLAGWLFLGKLERRFYQGEEVPTRNLPSKK